MASKLVAKTVLSVGYIPIRVVAWTGKNIAEVADTLAPEQARIAAAEAFARNEPLPYYRLREEYRAARMASIRYRFLHNPLGNFPGENQGNTVFYFNVRIMIALLVAYYAVSTLLTMVGPSFFTRHPDRLETLTLPFDKTERTKLLAATPGGGGLHH